MKGNLSTRTLAWLLAGISVLAIIFHLLILIRVIPYAVTWGGRLQSYDDVLVMVPVSLVVNVLFVSVILIKGGIWNVPVSQKYLNAVLWLMGVVFALNTLGNLMAITWAERLIATPLTLLASVLSFRLARVS